MLRVLSTVFQRIDEWFQQTFENQILVTAKLQETQSSNCATSWSLSFLLLLSNIYILSKFSNPRARPR